MYPRFEVTGISFTAGLMTWSPLFPPGRFSECYKEEVFCPFISNPLRKIRLIIIPTIKRSQEMCGHGHKGSQWQRSGLISIISAP